MDRGTGSEDKTSEVREQILSALKVIANHQLSFLSLLSLRTIMNSYIAIFF